MATRPIGIELADDPVRSHVVVIIIIIIIIRVCGSMHVVVESIINYLSPFLLVSIAIVLRVCRSLLHRSSTLSSHFLPSLSLLFDPSAIPYTARFSNLLLSFYIYD